MFTRSSHRSKASSKGKSSKDKSGKSHKQKSGKDKSGQTAVNTGSSSLLKLWCAIYYPQFGNYYHWAFAVSDTADSAWHIFEVTQEVQDGPFTAVHRRTNPTRSQRCVQPLTYLGQMHEGNLSPMINQIRQITVPGEALSWNCQDYVIEIWDALLGAGIVSPETWQSGRAQMLQYYGQDFGGSGGDESGVSYGYGGYEGYEDDDQDGNQRIVSEEFVYDSDE
ncbi:hypothetical protein PLICBS_004148 [Purpureocillium lilacinum]|uniref:uncharacterized protein n=1 Tax=Purpureocillium lilacinum TaxID=33203 RepID=UPI00207F9CBF|nr:hypothetical protein PLICBS_004148 [Purpureocillium lilacinum]